MSAKKVIHIKAAPAQAVLSPAQKKFNSLIKKIDAQKQLLAEWQEMFERCRRDAVEKLAPLKQSMKEQQTAMVQLLDRQFTSNKFTQIQQEKLTHIIVELCEELLCSDDNAELKAMYNKYTQSDYDTEAEEEQDVTTEFMKSMFEKEFGIVLDDDDIDLQNPQATAERLTAKVKQLEAEAEAAAAARPQRKKSAKQLAKEAREAEEAANVSKSIQAVYRQLTAALHPDREQDPVERERKTELMQQVTVAYSNKDLLKLLELQLAVEQIDQSKLSSLSAERLKHYNKILSDQLAELQDEVMLKEEQIRMMLQLSPFEPLSPNRLVTLLKHDIQAMQAALKGIQNDLQVFQDVKNLKAWLKNFRLPQPESGFDPFFDEFPPFR
ncbi:MAG: molecular chaperone DnaJ [Nitrosomonas sp.]|nr:molecular chaperone DnaJ [Nitrosomonas sp.]